MADIAEIMDMIDWHMPSEIPNQRSIIGKGYGNNHSVYTTVNTRA